MGAHIGQAGFLQGTPYITLFQCFHPRPVVTQIILRLIPLPKVQVDRLVPYDSFQDAADTVSAIVANRIVPATIRALSLSVSRIRISPACMA